MIVIYALYARMFHDSYLRLIGMSPIFKLYVSGKYPIAGEIRVKFCLRFLNFKPLKHMKLLYKQLIIYTNGEHPEMERGHGH